MKVKAIERVGNRLKWIDQTALPGRLVHKESDNYNEIISAIKRLEIRGAPAIGIAAAYGIA
ncbi:MAG TPA: S-methyl-5-thioribose-1-phosphate isomerase, partial [candidate division Zixibacteria bacterium]|nr:S-methyl-5-thioribose-1-phosphate isomerase [candidate division Zixibacteria bacterium]